MDNDLPLGLARKETYASLSPSELESLGKRASNMFLCDGIPLNEAVIKVASETPSISTHQVRRIVEFANTETFQHLFEKQAGDKNIEFDVADPGVILRSLETRAQGHTMTMEPSEYSAEPVKLASVAPEADIELCRAFGFDPALPGGDETSLVAMEKHADGTLTIIDRIMSKTSEIIPGGKASGKPSSDFSDKQLEMGKKVELEHSVKPGSKGNVALATEIAKDHLEEFPDYYSRLKKMEDQASAEKKAGILGRLTGAERAAASGVQALSPKAVRGIIGMSDAAAHTLPKWVKPAALVGGGLGLAGGGLALASRRPSEEMVRTASANPITDALSLMKVAQPPLMAGPMMDGEEQMGGPLMAGPAAPDTQDQHHEQLLSLERQIEIEKKKQELVNIQQKTFEMLNPQPEQPMMDPNQMQGDPNQQMAPQQEPVADEMGQGGPESVYGPNGEVIARGPRTKMSSALLKEAMDMSKTSAGSGHTLLIGALRDATSIESIRKVAASRPAYPEANPYGELFRTKQKVAALTEDALHARDRNEMLLKEAEDNWKFQVKQHLLNDGNLGEVAHIIDHVDGQPENIKLAMNLVAQVLDNPRFDAVRLQAQAIKYEMEKGAQARLINPQNPLVEAYGALVKVADAGRVLSDSYEELRGALSELEQEVQRVCRG